MRPLLIIPNVFSALRLVLALWFPFAPQSLRPAILIGAASSDFADGFLARRLKLTSWIGGLLDAAADKLFALSVLLTFTLGSELAWWQTLLLLARDIVVGLIACYAVALRKWYAFRHMPARLLGKLTTAALFLYFLLLATIEHQPPVLWAAFALAAAISLAAAADYLAVFSHARRQDRGNGSPAPEPQP